MGLTQRELARILNISHSTLAMYELGKREPDFETIIRIADYFHVSVDYLLDRTDVTKNIDDNILAESQIIQNELNNFVSTLQGLTSSQLSIIENIIREFLCVNSKK